MKKWSMMGLLHVVSFGAMAQEKTTGELADRSPIGYVVIGVILLIIVIYMLYSRQKRKFND